MYLAAFYSVTYLGELRRFHHGNADRRCQPLTGDSCSTKFPGKSLKFTAQKVPFEAYSCDRSSCFQSGNHLYNECSYNSNFRSVLGLISSSNVLEFKHLSHNKLGLISRSKCHKIAPVDLRSVFDSTRKRKSCEIFPNFITDAGKWQNFTAAIIYASRTLAVKN